MSLDISRTTLGIAAGIAGTIFLSYCIYFDKKRRSDPEYKKKVRERKYKILLIYCCDNRRSCGHLMLRKFFFFFKLVNFHLRIISLFFLLV